MVLYIEKPKDTTRKLLELINEYSKVAGYKINTQKSLVFLYTNNEKTVHSRDYCDFPGGPVVKIQTSTAGAWVQSLIRELRSYIPHAT